MAAKRRRPSKFDRLEHSLEARGDSNPRALAAWIGDRKYGKKAMARKSAAARRRDKRGRFTR